MEGCIKECLCHREEHRTNRSLKVWWHIYHIDSTNYFLFSLSALLQRRSQGYMKSMILPYKPLNYSANLADKFIMNERKERLFHTALLQYNRIFPCSECDTWDECYTLENNRILFWFNTDEGTTHLLMDEAA